MCMRSISFSDFPNKREVWSAPQIVPDPFQHGKVNMLMMVVVMAKAANDDDDGGVAVKKLNL